MTITEEMLMAYADGAADEAARAEVERQAAADPDVAARLARHLSLKSRLSGAFDGALSEPVPERLVEAATAGAPKAGRSPLRDWRTWSAMAACLAAGVLVGVRMADHGPISPDFRARGQLAAALDQRLASDPAGPDQVRIGVSFRSQEGAYCRTFQTPGARGMAGFACRDEDAWRVLMSVPHRPEGGEYRLAGSAPAPVMRAAGAMAAGDVLDAQAEAAARAAGWR